MLATRLDDDDDDISANFTFQNSLQNPVMGFVIFLISLAVGNFFLSMENLDLGKTPNHKGTKFDGKGTGRAGRSYFLGNIAPRIINSQDIRNGC